MVIKIQGIKKIPTDTIEWNAVNLLRSESFHHRDEGSFLHIKNDEKERTSPKNLKRPFETNKFFEKLEKIDRDIIEWINVKYEIIDETSKKIYKNKQDKLYLIKKKIKLINLIKENLKKEHKDDFFTIYAKLCIGEEMPDKQESVKKIYAIFKDTLQKYLQPQYENIHFIKKPQNSKQMTLSGVSKKQEDLKNGQNDILLSLIEIKKEIKQKLGKLKQKNEILKSNKINFAFLLETSAFFKNSCDTYGDPLSLNYKTQIKDQLICKNFKVL